MLSRDMLNSLLDYRDGELFIKNTSKSVTYGSREGYRLLKIGSKTYRAHRVIWAMHNQDVPKILDHVNRIRHDNRLENLRPATASENAANSSTTGPLGFKGVYLCKRRNRYYAVVTKDGLKHSYGYYETGIEAAKAYDKAASEFFGDFAVLNFY